MTTEKVKTEQELELERETLTLQTCPFCFNIAEFYKNRDGKLFIRHHPPKGVVCPARYEQQCDSYDQGRRWWNDRFIKIDIEEAEKGKPNSEC